MSRDHEDIIRVIEEEGTKKLCLIRIYKEADSTPRPVIELERKDQQYFVYDILQRFGTIQEAHEYAQSHGIVDIEY